MMHCSKLLLAAFSLLAAPAALAHPAVTAATPAAGSTVASPRQITLKMSEPLVAKLSGATLVMTGMPGMPNHAPMPIPTKTSVGADGKTLVVMPARALPAGKYRLDWHAVSTDTHRITGTHEFGVK